jgi:hypothetical protein
MAGAAHVFIIGDWTDEASSSIRIQNFERDGQAFIPVFTSEHAFREQAAGSPSQTRGCRSTLRCCCR